MTQTLICPACWNLMAGENAECPSCHQKWAVFFDGAQRVRDALAAMRWPLELIVAVDTPERRVQQRYSAPARIAIAGDGRVSLLGEGEDQDAALMIVANESGAISLDGPAMQDVLAGRAQTEECATPWRFNVGTARVTLRIRARPRCPSGPEIGKALSGISATIPPARRTAILGRGVTADACIADSSVGTEHLLVARDADGRVWVIDLCVGESTAECGTWVNDRPIVAAPLDRDDLLQVGRVGLLLFDGQAVLRQPVPVLGHEIVLRNLVLEHKIGPRWRRHRKTVRIQMAESECRIPPGAFVGIIGGSGAGKTTLLRALAGLKSPARGSIEVDGKPLRPGPKLASSLGYVPQDDIVHTALTVRQALTYAARLRTEEVAESIDRLLEEVVALVELSDRVEQRIDRLSGGQRKRVSIAVELLARPSVLLLDEPTSGLDPATEFKLMRRLSILARRGQTVILTTHILSSIDLLDRVIVLERRAPDPRQAPSQGGVVARIFDGRALLFQHYQVDDPRGLFQKLEQGPATQRLPVGRAHGNGTS